MREISELSLTLPPFTDVWVMIPAMRMGYGFTIEPKPTYF